MAPKTKDTTTESPNHPQKRTQVKDLPEPERKLSEKEMEKVKGGD